MKCLPSIASIAARSAVAGLLAVAPASAAERIPGVLPDLSGQRLYVSTITSSYGATGTTYAYSIVDGLATTPAVLTYGGVAGPLAVLPDGQLLAGDGPAWGCSSFCFSSGVVGYYRDTTTESRQFFGPINRGCNEWVITALAAAPRGEMFVGNYCYHQYAYTRALGPLRAWPNVPMQDVVAWQSRSSTKQRFEHVIAAGAPPGLATDSAGNLYISQGDGIHVYSRPIEAPTQIRLIVGTSFTGSGRAPGALWIDRSGELYVYDGGPGTVSAYPDTANGTVSPDRTIAGAAGAITDAIAVSRNTLFATYVNGSVTGVEAFDKRVGGTQTPRQQLAIPNLHYGITVGL